MRKLAAVQDSESALRIINQDKGLFPVRRKADIQEVTRWVRDRIIADYDYATQELSPQSRLTIELRHYHAVGSGLEVSSKIHTGEKGTGSILWLQVVVRLSERDYLWWSHN